MGCEFEFDGWGRRRVILHCRWSLAGRYMSLLVGRWGGTLGNGLRRYRIGGSWEGPRHHIRPYYEGL